MGTVFYFYPFPGTKLFNICKEYDLLLSDDEMTQSGYLESSSIKEIHCKKSDCIKIYQKIRLFLAVKGLGEILSLPKPFIKLLYWITRLYSSFFVRILTKKSNIKNMVRQLLYSRLWKNQRN
jgi:hypothetical protein